MINIKFIILFGYFDVLKLMIVVMVNNVFNKEIVFDGFEDYNYLIGVYFVGESYFSFNGVINVIVDGNNYYSGLKLVKIVGGFVVMVNKIVFVVCDEGRYDIGNFENWIIRFLLCNCIFLFILVMGVMYVIGVWIK